MLALLLIPAIWTGGLLLTRVLGMDMPNARYSTFDAELLVLIVLLFLSNFIHGGLSEEPGWRGFALPRLQARFSPLVSSLILGVIWAVWHAPARFGGVEAKSVEDTGVEWMLIVLLSIIFTWLYNRTKGSVLVGALLHASMNATGHFLPATLFALALLIAVVIFAIVSDRMWAVTDHGHRSILSD